MPYITPEIRVKFDRKIDALVRELLIYTDSDDQTGVTTYVIFKILKNMYAERDPLWIRRAQVWIILNSVRSEFERRFIFSYEDEKIKQNGDVK